MTKNPKQNEKEYIAHLLRWEQKESKQQLIFYNICFIAGNILILFSLIHLLNNIGDNSIYWIGLLGIISAIPFFIVYSFGIKSINEKNMIISILKKRKHKSN